MTYWSQWERRILRHIPNSVSQIRILPKGRKLREKTIVRFFTVLALSIVRNTINLRVVSDRYVSWGESHVVNHQVRV
jgi:hypothetical protein